ncbi:MAG: Ger(x)C family spore germination protein [Syntrophomonadaceae bacterium]
MKRLSAAVLIILLLLSPGCGSIEINQASVPMGMAIDYKDQQIHLAVQMANPTSPEKSGGQGPKFFILTATGRTIIEAVRNIMLSFPRFPLWSQAGIYIFGEDFARSDMAIFADSVTRNRFIRKNIPIVVAHGATAQELINVKPLIEPYTSTAIRDLLQTQESQLGIYTPVTMIEFVDRLSAPGIEPVLPMVTIDRSAGKEKLLLDGMAVFKDRKMVGTLNEAESRGYRLLRPKMIEGGLFVIRSPQDENGWITLELSRSQAKITPVVEGSQITMKIELKAEGNFYEQTGTGDLFSLPMFNQLNALASQELEKEIRQCIAQAQTLNSDFLGWGQTIQASHPGQWKELEPQWGQVFPTVQADVKVDFQIRRSYLTDKSFVFRE